MSAKGTQVKAKKPKQQKGGKPNTCPWLCSLVPSNVPSPGAVQAVLHPRKDVFVLKVSMLFK